MINLFNVIMRKVKSLYENKFDLDFTFSENEIIEELYDRNDG